MIVVASTCLTGAAHWRTSWIMAQVAISMLSMYSMAAFLAILSPETLVSPNGKVDV
jgi:hypothetical protein